MAPAGRLVEHDLAAFGELGPHWDRLAERAGSIYLGSAWTGAWWRAVGGDDAFALALHEGDAGELLAGAVFVRGRSGRLRAAADAEAADWDVVAADERSRERFWELVAARRHPRLELSRLPSDTKAAVTARRALTASGYTLVEATDIASPTLALPATYDDLLAGMTSKTRSETRRLRRVLERAGDVSTRRCVAPGAETDAALDTLLDIEAAGWKGAAGTAIRDNPSWERLYRDFTASAAAAGLLRLHVLELDGRPIAAALGTAFAGAHSGLKLAVADDVRRLSPGAVLVQLTIEWAIEEGLSRFNFLGNADAFKSRWTDAVHPHTTVHAFRGARTLPQRLWWVGGRPLAKRLRDRVRPAAR